MTPAALKANLDALRDAVVVPAEVLRSGLALAAVAQRDLDRFRVRVEALRRAFEAPR